MSECNLKANLSQCTCTYLSCHRRGKCCECVYTTVLTESFPGAFSPEKLSEPMTALSGNSSKSAVMHSSWKW